MKELLVFLQASGGVGVWVLVYMWWNFKSDIIKFKGEFNTLAATNSTEHEEIKGRLDRANI